MGGYGARGLISFVLLVCFPFSLFAADSNAAMLYTNGAIWVNGTHVPRSSSAIFSGDLLQTRHDSIANINEPGSIVTVLSDSLVHFELATLRIEHGGVTVATSKGVSAIAGQTKVVPASQTWTEFTVTDVDGTISIAARKGDVNVDDGTKTVTLAQGQQTTTRDQPSETDNNGKKKSKKRGTGAAPGASGGLLNSPYAVGAGVAVAGGITVWALTRPEDPASPSKP